ncbi:MAG: PAS domain S-box protein [Planctomycetaceae bacterium]|nr:PAS domain S-box protein [Planctomycetaceae bacterium]
MKQDAAITEISLESLSGIVPFILVTDENMTIMWASSAILKHRPEAVGIRISDLLKLKNCSEEISTVILQTKVDESREFLLLNNNNETPLIGRWLRSGDGFVLLATPNAKTNEDLSLFSMDDFPEHDHLIDLLVARGETFFSLKEAASAASALKNKNREIETAKRRLESVNAVLENEITERKKAEEEIRRSQQILQDMLDAMPFGVLVVGKDKIIRRVNNAVMKLTGFDKEELVGSLCHRTLCPAEINKCPILDCGQTLDHSERKLITKQGQTIPIIKTAVPLKIGNEEVLLEAFMDITDRKKDEEKVKHLNAELESSMVKLKEANEEMKNFVYIASHDLREPLRKITAFGSILEKSLKDKLDADDSENLKFMIDGATRMNMMIEGLLAYSRASTRKLPPQAVDLNEIITQLRQFELSVVLQEKNVIVEVPASLPCVNADPGQIRQMLQNIIANGIKYQPKDRTPKITIASKPDADGMVRIEVSDNGIGIKPEYLTSIFAMFKRLHTRNEYEGTGIGLAVCKKIAERHGGKIGAESEYGKGSTFWFTVPAVGNNVEYDVIDSKNQVKSDAVSAEEKSTV